jgi:integrase
MKAGREHRVPLSDAAVTLLRGIDSSGPFVFPGFGRNEALSNTAMLMCLRRLNVPVTAHGFRSSFRDWASEHTSFPRQVCEMALAHVIANKAEAAYRRGDLFDKRRKLMEAWARYCAEPAKENVVAISSGARTS